MMDQLNVIDAYAIRKANEQTNYMTVNRVKASRSILFKKTRNINAYDVPHWTSSRIVSLAPELSLATIGSTIPVIEMPPNLPYPELKEVAVILTMIGHMVATKNPPTTTITTLGDKTKKIPNAHKRGTDALQYCMPRM